METILKGGHPRSIWTKYALIPSSGSEEDFQRFPFFNQSEAMAAMLEVPHGTSNMFLEEDHPRSITLKIGTIRPNGS